MLVVHMSAIERHRDRDTAVPLSASTELASRCGSGKDEDNNAEEHSQVLAEEVNTTCDVTSCHTISLCRIVMMQHFFCPPLACIMTISSVHWNKKPR
jgi:hypothetical protein